MKNNILITYDLNKSGQNYAALIEKIKTLGAWAKVQQSAWYLHTSYSSKEVLEMLSTVTDYNDSLLLLNYPRLIGEDYPMRLVNLFKNNGGNRPIRNFHYLYLFRFY